LTYENVEKKVKEILDKKTEEINKIISTENPSSLAGTSKKIFDILKNGSYPNNIDLYQILYSNATVYDEVIKSVLWNNYNSATIKYKYVFEHYLDID
jgi:hypothetical protein